MNVATPAAVPRRRVTLSSRDLYFATHHQAAHAVVATMLGCGIDHLEIGFLPENIGWNPDLAPSGDFETICAAGLAMELLLGRRHEAAWDQCRDDRAILKRIVLERTGTAMVTAEITDRFMEGVSHGRAILEHPAVRAVIDIVAEALADAYLAKEEGLKGTDIRLMIGPLIGFDASHAEN